MLTYYLPHLHTNKTSVHSCRDQQQSCHERDWYFSILTLTFIYLPSPMMMQMVFDRATVSVLNIIWGVILATSSLLILQLQNFDPDHNFGSFVVIVALTVGLFTLLFGLATVSHAFNSYQDLRAAEKVKKVLMMGGKLFLSSKFIIFLPLLVLAPVINILTKESFQFRK